MRPWSIKHNQQKVEASVLDENMIIHLDKLGTTLILLQLQRCHESKSHNIDKFVCKYPSL